MVENEGNGHHTAQWNVEQHHMEAVALQSQEGRRQQRERWHVIGDQGPGHVGPRLCSNRRGGGR